MFCMQVGADMTGRVNDRLTAYTLAMAAVIWWRPLAFFDAGFQLSFGAVGAVLFLYPLITSGKNTFGKLAESLLVSLSIELITVPVILYHYYELPTWSVIIESDRDSTYESGAVTWISGQYGTYVDTSDRNQYAVWMWIYPGFF